MSFSAICTRTKGRGSSPPRSNLSTRTINPQFAGSVCGESCFTVAPVCNRRYSEGRTLLPLLFLVLTVVTSPVLLAGQRNAAGAPPISYRVTFPAPEHHWMQVEVTFSRL